MSKSKIQILTEKYGDDFKKYLAEREGRGLNYWELEARPEQLPPLGYWETWLLMGGRGGGKTRPLIEWGISRIESGFYRICCVSPTAADCRDTIAEGESGFLDICDKRGIKCEYHSSKGRLEFPTFKKPEKKRNPHIKLVSAEEPRRLRGPNFEAGLADEIAYWKNADIVWKTMQLGVRIGKNPQIVVATTPTASPFMKGLIKEDNLIISRTSTYDNKANLSPIFFNRIKKFEGTRIGRQELYGELIEDNEDALFLRENLDKYRVSDLDKFGGKNNKFGEKYQEFLNSMISIIVALDPAATSGENADDTGIVVVGKRVENGISHFYILNDATCHVSPGKWAAKAVQQFDKYRANRIIGEANHGGDMIKTIIRNIAPNIPYKKVTASRGKQIRAEPVSQLCEQGRLHIVGSFPKLEDQMCQWSPEETWSPDRMDALVWGVTYLMKAKRTKVSMG